MPITLTGGQAMTKQPAPAAYLLSDLRREASMTQLEVAERMGVSKKRVSQIEALYPNIRYDTLINYLEAVGGYMQLGVGALRIRHDQIVSDPNLEGTREWKRVNSERGVKHFAVGQRALSEELPLQGDQTDTGSDDTGGQVDHADTQSDQGDSGQRQQS